MGALVTEALAAADRLEALGRPADVVCVTSPERLLQAVQARRWHAETSTASTATTTSTPTASSAPPSTSSDEPARR